MATGDLISLTIRDATQFDQDGNGYGVDGNGWIAELLIAGLPSIDPTAVNPNKIVTQTRDPGFDATGTATTVDRSIRGGKVIRHQAPNDALLWVDQVLGNTRIRFSLEEEVYQGTTLLSAAVQAGLYPGSTVGAVPSLVNNSTFAYRKPHVAWLNQQFERATGATYSVELAAYHWHGRNGRQVACVKFQARDAQASANLSPVVTSAAPALSGIQTQGLRVEAYKGALALANLTQGDACKVNATVYPWIGDASAVVDLLADGFAWPTTNPRTPLQFCCDKAGTYGGAYAYVKAGASGGTASRVAATARAAPFASITAAIAALAAINNAAPTAPTHNDTGGGYVRMMDDGAGGGVAHQLGGFSGVPGKCWVTIELDPQNTAPAGSVKVQTTGINGVADLVDWHVPLEQTGFNSFDGGGSARVAFNGSTMKQVSGGLPINYDCGYCFFRNVTLLDGGTGFSGFFTFSNEPTETLLALGIVGPAGMGGNFGPHVGLGCDLPKFGYGMRPTGYGTHTEDGNIIANNRFLNVYGTSIIGSAWDIDQGFAWVQNVLECPNNQLQPAFQIGADGMLKRLKNVLAFHNTIVGERTNWFYLDVNGGQGIVKRGSARFNLLSNWNAKTDTFRTSYYGAAPDNSTGRVFNWFFRYGVSQLGNVVMTGDRSGNYSSPKAFLADYFPGGQYNVGEAAVHFTNNQAPDTGAGATPGAGMGDYSLTGATNAAYNQVPAGMQMMAFDIVGNPRMNDGTGASGAYEKPIPPDTTPDAFAFDPVTGAPLSTATDSNVVTITGLNAASPVSVTGGTVSINGGAQVSSGNITNGQTIKARLNSSASYSTLASATVTIGGVSAEFDVTTAAAPTPTPTPGPTPTPTPTPGPTPTPTPGPTPITATGAIVATAERIVAVTPTGNAYAWSQPLDPSDRAPYAIDWTALLPAGQTIAQIDRITMSAEGAALGVQVDTGSGRDPIISTDRKLTQVWFVVASADQADPAFSPPGVQVSLSVLIRTDGTPYECFERTAVLTVRQQ